LTRRLSLAKTWAIMPNSVWKKALCTNGAQNLETHCNLAWNQFYFKLFTHYKPLHMSHSSSLMFFSFKHPTCELVSLLAHFWICSGFGFLTWRKVWLSSFWSFGFFFQVLRFQLAWRGFRRLWLALMMFGLAFGDMSTCLRF